VFTSAIWREFFHVSDTQLLMSSSYHPQTDGQYERLNQCLETFLHYSVHSCPKQWSKWLAVAEFWYNTSFHSSLGRTPFEALYGYAPRQFGLSSDTQFHSPSVGVLEQGVSRDRTRLMLVWVERPYFLCSLLLVLLCTEVLVVGGYKLVERGITPRSLCVGVFECLSVCLV
jgi:hypothetical protein